MMSRLAATYPSSPNHIWRNFLRSKIITEPYFKTVNLLFEVIHTNTHCVSGFSSSEVSMKIYISLRKGNIFAFLLYNLGNNYQKEGRRE